jgi:hypothetical protein
MKLRRDESTRFLRLASCLLVMCLSSTGRAGSADAGQSAVLEFLQPTNNALFSTLDEIPIMLRAFASNDVFLIGEVFANNLKIADVSYCCALCPCYRPQPGYATTLQIPVPWQNGKPPSRTWQGWTNVPARRYQLTARATGDNGTTVEATPVTITVIDRTLRIFAGSDGSVALVIPEGSLVPGGYDAEASQDLRKWERLGPFQPGNVAAFYFDVPPETARERRFYRSVYLPPSEPQPSPIRSAPITYGS